MSTLDAILDRATRFAGAGGVLCVASHEIRYQPGCGKGRPTRGQRVLLARNIENGQWELPPSDAIGNAQFGGKEFEPKLNPKLHDASCWIDMDVGALCRATAPSAAATIKSYTSTAAAGDQNKGNVTMDTHADFIKAQAKCDKVCQAHGEGEAPRAMQGEDFLRYRQRLISKHQHHSKSFKDADLSKVNDHHALDAIESEVYGSAMDSLKTGAHVPHGELLPVIHKDQAGREITRYVASADGACWDRFNPPVRYVRQLRTPGSARLQ